MTWFMDRYGPWALIAGASEGLGHAYAHALARRGLDIIMVARREAKLVASAEAITQEYGVQTLPVTLDLAAPDLLAQLREAIGERTIGTLVYNAAYSRVANFLDQDLDDKLRTLDVNCRAPLLLCHEYGTQMRERGRGAIILMGSLASLQGAPRLATYAATKAFDLILAESMWAELRGEGVEVLACVAGATRTPGFEAVAQHARGPVMPPEQVVEEALAALGRQPSVVTGLGNKLASLALSRLPRRGRVLIMDKALGDSSAGSRED